MRHGAAHRASLSARGVGTARLTPPPPNLVLSGGKRSRRPPRLGLPPLPPTGDDSQDKCSQRQHPRRRQKERIARRHVVILLPAPLHERQGKRGTRRAPILLALPALLLAVAEVLWLALVARCVNRHQLGRVLARMGQVADGDVRIAGLERSCEASEASVVTRGEARSAPGPR